MCGCLKVSKLQNEFMKSSFSQNMNEKLSGCLPYRLQEEILTLKSTDL